MTSTIETNNINILKKISLLKDICKLLNGWRDEGHQYKTINIENTAIGLEEIYNSYSLDTANILNRYFSLVNAKETETSMYKKRECSNLFNRYIKSNNICSKLDTVHEKLYNVYNLIFFSNEEIKKTHKLLYKELWKHFSEYKKIKIHTYIEEVKVNNLCKLCNEVMLISGINEQSCVKCGKCTEITTTIYDEENKILEVGHNKYGTYDPSKHCKYWIDRIQAREIIDMADIYTIADEIKKKLCSDKIRNNDYITCKLIRSYLHKLNKSAYNDYIPLIRKILTGITPPQLTEQELQKINIYFIKIIKLYNIEKPSSKINCPYHPYIIYKILEQILPDGGRKSAILACIHLQSSRTLIQNDKIWKKICNHIAEFNYLPTDRNKE